jgi:hypothetical protein
MCLRYWEPCVTEEHATEPAVIKRVSSDKFWVYREDSETEPCVLVSGKGLVLENPVVFRKAHQTRYPRTTVAGNDLQR